MPNVQQCEQSKDDLPPEKRKDLNNLIREQVINALGRPTDLLKVQVRKVWDDHYRVNVLVGANAGSIRVANSYFVVTDSSGGLIAASPKIAKLY
ncbi:MAG: hypothetical protein EXR98_24275 [Gemmataceae bacterium]|nr:hypothetical protein [Gemmataceae bacterium]